MSEASTDVPIPKYTGAANDGPVQDWFDLFELHATAASWSEREMVINFTDYISGEAFKFYLTHIFENDESWKKIKEEMIIHFKEYDEDLFIPHQRKAFQLTHHSYAKSSRSKPIFQTRPQKKYTTIVPSYDSSEKTSRIRTPTGNFHAATDKVSFHRFPKDAMIYKKWIVAIKRDEGPEFQVGKSTKVCSKHFRSSDFIPSVVSGRSLLRDSAVPSVFAFSKEKKERKPPKPRASPQVRSQNPVLGPGVLGDELMHSPDEVKAAPVGLEEPTRLNSSLEGENARLAETIKQKNNEIARLRDELCQIKEQLVAAKGIIGQLGFEKASLSCQLAAERERTAPFTVERFKDCDEDMLFYTGLPSYNHFKKLLVYLNPGDDGCNVLRSERTESSEPRSSRGRKRKLSTENELFLVLVRLRLGLFEDDLAHRFCIAQSTVSRICTSWINFLYAKLGLLPLWAPRRIVDATMPPEFKEKYSSTRVILDATEIQCEVPSSLSLQSTTYSPYKSSNTFKGLIGVLPNGLVAFVSELFTGSSSDRDSMAEDVVVSSHDMLSVTTD
ncbi:hypothetical protein HPB51_028063 [Rhipicephalus microplus]|uniref:THAP-type domain-containing protein n=1 Tax=Rhipicephalus microplus TaxID=6941 RepID=A0A9J6CYK8_RHIMP|nr:hypothetical protein HPB51_028063 [Rhipicephalus microplus]